MGRMSLQELVAAEFAIETTYLNTASIGVPPARTLEAMRSESEEWARGRASAKAYDLVVAAARESFARIAGTSPERVAIGTNASTEVGLVAGSLPAGAEVVMAEGDFSSLIQPFAGRDDLALRLVPLDDVADAVRPGTALVAVSAAQSADGRVADLAAIRAAASAHGALTLIDATQALGWMPISADEWDYVVCNTYKWLLCPRGVSFLVVSPRGAERVRPAYAGWYAGDDPWENCYGPVRLAADARRFDASPIWMAFVGAVQSLALIEEIGIARIGAHDLALADRFRAGLAELGHEPVGGRSAIVAVADLGHVADRLDAADVKVAVRAGGLRASFHLYNTIGDVDRTLDVLAGALVGPATRP
jgi:selenocysteine lyase/cysteine desulfurase